MYTQTHSSCWWDHLQLHFSSFRCNWKLQNKARDNHLCHTFNKTRKDGRRLFVTQQRILKPSCHVSQLTPVQPYGDERFAAKMMKYTYVVYIRQPCSRQQVSSKKRSAWPAFLSHSIEFFALACWPLIPQLSNRVSSFSIWLWLCAGKSWQWLEVDSIGFSSTQKGHSSIGRRLGTKKQSYTFPNSANVRLQLTLHKQV